MPCPSAVEQQRECEWRSRVLECESRRDELEHELRRAADIKDYNHGRVNRSYYINRHTATSTCWAMKETRG